MRQNVRLELPAVEWARRRFFGPDDTAARGFPHPRPARVLTPIGLFLIIAAVIGCAVDLWVSALSR